MADLGRIEIREVRGAAEFEQIAQIQLEVWGFAVEDIAAPHLIMVHQHLGGVVVGAFEPDGRMVAFTYSFFGLRRGRTIQWSHMLAVLPGRRGLGLGKLLKWKQRELVLERGVDCCCWTFDPLEAVNAHLNCVTLGGTCNEYVINAYGSSSGPLHSGLPTDRLVLVWDLKSPGVERRARGEVVHAVADPASLPACLVVGDRGGVAAPLENILGLDEGLLALPILPDVQRAKRESPEAALAWRMAVREVLTHYFARGYALIDVFPAREPASPNFLFVLGRNYDEGRTC